MLNLANVCINVTVPRKKIVLADCKEEDKEDILELICCHICKSFPIDLVQCAVCNKVFCESHFYESYIDNQCMTKCCNSESGQLKAGFDGKFSVDDNSNSNNSTKTTFLTTTNKELNLFKLVSNIKVRCKNEACTEVMEILQMLRHEKNCRKNRVLNNKQIATSELNQSGDSYANGVIGDANSEEMDEDDIDKLKQAESGSEDTDEMNKNAESEEDNDQASNSSHEEEKKLTESEDESHDESEEEQEESKHSELNQHSTAKVSNNKSSLSMSTLDRPKPKNNLMQSTIR